MEAELKKLRGRITLCKYLVRLSLKFWDKSFSEFDTYIQKAKKQILDTRNHTAIKNVASELKDVHKIMGKKDSNFGFHPQPSSG